MKITKDQIESMMVGAIEGGSNYWYDIRSWAIIEHATKDMEGEPIVMRILKGLEFGLSLPIYDIEDQDTNIPFGILTQESFQKAFDLMFKNHPHHFADLIGQTDDAITADVFFQLAVMGELVFG